MSQALLLSYPSAPQDESSGVWLNTGATALHKFVISFSVGVELVSNKVQIPTHTR